MSNLTGSRQAKIHLSLPQIRANAELERRRRLRLRQSSDQGSRWDFYGGAARLLDSTDHQVIIAGPAETGKTLAALVKLHRVCLKYPRTQAAIVRRTYQSMPGSVLQTYGDVIEGSGVMPFGGEKPQWYDYPNRSRVWVGGMDHPDKVLSSERDFIFVNQAEELDVADWETLTTRATGRAGHVPDPQVIGDCNPSTPTHWIRQTSIPLLESRHEDNPQLFNQETGEITEQGKRSLAILDLLTGPRKARLRYGQWAGAEGMCYEDSWDRARNVIDRFEIPADWRRYLAIDFGFTNPFVCQWWAEDPDGRLYLYREIYRTQRLVEDHARQIKDLSQGERIEAAVCDHDAEGRATFEKYADMPTVGAKKQVLEGIQAVAARLRSNGDKRARLFLLRDSLVEVDAALKENHKPTSTEEEIEGYIWKAGAKKDEKEEPVKENDHGCDATRYMVAHLDLRVPVNPWSFA
jgi:PBSX family phage terminase large subunit